MASSTAPAPVGSVVNHARPSSMMQRPASTPRSFARKRVEPVLPLPYLQRRSKQPPATTQVPSPLRTNSEEDTTLPNSDSNQARQTTPEVKDLATDSKPMADGPAPPQKINKEDTGSARAEAHLHPQEPEPVSVGPATQGAAVHQPVAGVVTPPGMSIWCRTIVPSSSDNPPQTSLQALPPRFRFLLPPCLPSRTTACIRLSTLSTTMLYPSAVLCPHRMQSTGRACTSSIQAMAVWFLTPSTARTRPRLPLIPAPYSLLLCPWRMSRCPSHPSTPSVGRLYRRAQLMVLHLLP